MSRLPVSRAYMGCKTDLVHDKFKNNTKHTHTRSCLFLVLAITGQFNLCIDKADMHHSGCQQKTSNTKCCIV